MSRVFAGPFNRVEGDLELQLDINDGRVEEALRRKRDSRHTFHDSPVYSVLSRAAQHIVPLNLLQPQKQLLLKHQHQQRKLRQHNLQQ